MNNDHLLIIDTKPTRADAVKNRELLLKTAQKLIQKCSVETVTMSAIAKEAGVGKGTLYRHFKDKTDLCHALLDQETRELQNNTLEKLRLQENPLETLSWFLEQIVMYVDANSTLLIEASNQSPVDYLQHPAHVWWRQTIVGQLERLNFVGDLQYTADMIYIMLDVRTIHFQIHELGYSRERIINALLNIIECVTNPA